MGHGVLTHAVIEYEDDQAQYWTTWTTPVTIQVVGVDSKAWNESGLPVSILSKAWSRDQPCLRAVER